MSRLFITPREIQFAQDIIKEYTKDIMGQFIYYYPISMLHTQVHPVYDEALEKVFERPIKLDALVGQPQSGQEYSSLGLEETTTIEVFLQTRDLKDKNIEPAPGDVFVYGDEVFEIMKAFEEGDMYGQAEYGVFHKLAGALVRSGRMDFENFRKLLEDRGSQASSNVQRTFEQQRGLGETDTHGPTGDVRQVRERLADDMAPIALGEGPRRVTPEDEEDTSDTSGEKTTSSFYNE
jgi:hypothetical protein